MKIFLIVLLLAVMPISSIFAYAKNPPSVPTLGLAFTPPRVEAADDIAPVAKATTVAFIARPALVLPSNARLAVVGRQFTRPPPRWKSEFLIPTTPMWRNPGAEVMHYLLPFIRDKPKKDADIYLRLFLCKL